MERGTILIFAMDFIIKRDTLSYFLVWFLSFEIIEAAIFLYMRT